MTWRRHQVLDILALLVDKSLVIAETSGAQHDTGCWKRFASTRRRNSANPPKRPRVRDRHRDYYTAIASALDRPTDTNLELLLDQVQAELDNLRAAFAWSRENFRPRKRLAARHVPAAVVVDTRLPHGRVGLAGLRSRRRGDPRSQPRRPRRWPVHWPTRRI